MIEEVKYGDTFYLEVWGYASDTVGENIKGYLALYAPVAEGTTSTPPPLTAVTTLTPVATWKFESSDGKIGPVCIGHTVRIVYSGAEPASTDQLPTPRYLQGTEGDADSIKAVHDDPGSTPDKSLEWDIYTGTKRLTQTQTSVPVTYDLYIMLSCSLTPVQPYTDGGKNPNATGAFLVAKDPRDVASGTFSTIGIIDYVGTRTIGNAYTGADTWWKPVKITALPT